MSRARAGSLISRTPEATSSPPRPPTSDSPSTRRNVDTEERSYRASRRLGAALAAPCPDGEAPITRFDADRVPAAVLLLGARKGQRVLPAQLVGQTGGGRLQFAEAADDLGAAPGLVGDVAQRIRIDALAGRTAPRASASAADDWRRQARSPS